MELEVPTVQSYSEAAILFKIASEEKIPQAEHNLGLLYEYGNGVQQDFSMAMYYYKRAVEKNFIESMYNLGTIIVVVKFIISYYIIIILLLL